jgi:hypothetical protein
VSEPTLALHSALIAAIDQLVTCEVWDGMPQNVAYPYVVMDFTVSGNEDYTNARMDRRYVYLSIWSRAEGQAEVMGIMAQLDALNNSTLTLTTGAVASIRVERKRTNREPDNLTFMGHMTLRILTTH